MKTIFLFLLASISVLLISCEGDTYLDQKDTHPKNSSLQPKTWQEQLEYSKNKSNLKKSIRANGNSIRCIDYTYKGRIETEADIHRTIEELFSENSVTVQYTDESNFEIVSMKTIMQKSKILGVTDIFTNVKSQLEATIQVGMELLEIEWLYGGRTFYSIAVASNDRGGIIYDNIGHFIRETAESEVKSTDLISMNRPLIKTRSESDSNNESSSDFRKSDSGYNFYNIEVWSYELACTSYFNKAGILRSRNMNSSRDAAIGWACEVGIQTITGDIDVSKFHEFAWAYAYGPAFTVSVSWNGASFSISSGGHSSTGTEVHRAK